MEANKKFTKKEEIANGLSHLAGAVLSTVGLVLMVVYSAAHGNGWHVATTAVFGASLIILYLSSTFTHMLPGGPLKDFFFNFDRIAIYFLIAGTYTPLALVVLQGTLGWVIFGLEWGLALTGTLMILRRPGDFDTGVNTFYVLSYALMGWLILVAVVPVMDRLPGMGWMWIFIGGLSYSLGILFFKVIKFPYHHLVWHMLVLGGSISHFFAIFFHVIPR
ncbi:MAG: hemolysin III family protein [Bacteroidales bacterium]